MILSVLLILSSCGSAVKPEPEIVVQTQTVKRNIPIIERPKPVDLVNPRFFVVTPENFEEFKAEFKRLYGTETYVVISVKDYEKLALNMAELKRYIEQQKEVIIYYEEQIQR